MQFIDLSREVVSGMPVFPGDPDVAIDPALTLAGDGVAVTHLALGSHTGTHLDAPSHSVAGGRTVDEIPLELLCGPARVLRSVVSHEPRAMIRAEDLDVPTKLPPIVCVATGWDRHFGTAEMTAHPSLSLELAELLWERGARVLCVDALSPDSSADLTAGLPVHEMWLGRDGVIVENLTALHRVPDEIELSLFPLRLTGVDGSPIRAVARIG